MNLSLTAPSLKKWMLSFNSNYVKHIIINSIQVIDMKKRHYLKMKNLDRIDKN